jgi:hypothetical protein
MPLSARAYCYLLLVLFVLSCQPKVSNTFSERDQLFHEYLQLVDSLYMADSADIPSSVWLAYYRNDTATLRFKKEVALNGYEWRESEVNGGNAPTLLRNLGAEEAYRFYYSEAFCLSNTVVTLARYNDSVTISLSSYYSLRGFDSLTVSGKKIKHYDTIIDTSKVFALAGWDSLSAGIVKADYWGLAPSNGHYGLDGSDLTVIGYQRRSPTYDRKPRAGYVHRWGWQQNTLLVPYIELLKLFGQPSACIGK